MLSLLVPGSTNTSVMLLDMLKDISMASKEKILCEIKALGWCQICALWVTSINQLRYKASPLTKTNIFLVALFIRTIQLSFWDDINILYPSSKIQYPLAIRGWYDWGTTFLFYFIAIKLNSHIY